jgi:hypothetical protein
MNGAGLPLKNCGMKTISSITLLLLIAATPIHAQQDNAKSESIHDRIISIEPKLFTGIPNVPRFCDRLPFKKQRINVGDCSLYVEEEGGGPPRV